MFDPREYRPIAESCCFAIKNEAAYRTAIGRLYYAAFLVAREQLHQNHGIVFGKKVNAHQALINELWSIDGDIAQGFTRLRRLREWADYDLAYNDAEVHVQEALDLSHELIASF